LIKDLVKDPMTAITRGSTFENKGNLAKSFLQKIVQRYEGTRLGRQEIDAELLGDVEGALWTYSMLDSLRVAKAPEMRRIVVAVDPSVADPKASPGADECGIVVAGLGADGHGYVLDDLSGHYSPGDWAQRVVRAYEAHSADRIVAEENNGGKLVELAIRTASPLTSYKSVRAAQGKRARAEPVAALYEQGRVHHVGTFSKLEDQLCTWEPITGVKSPDRLDALVWALTELVLDSPPVARNQTAPLHYQSLDDVGIYAGEIDSLRIY
jgi:phage terminase large subunit-like protein